MITEETVAALRSEHGSVCVIRGLKKEALIVVRGVTKKDLAPHYESEDPGQAHWALTEACLLAPSIEELLKLRAKSPVLVTMAFLGARKISGEQCSVEYDEKAGTFSAHVTKASAEDGGEPEKTTVYRGKGIGWPQYQRYLSTMRESKLDARITACVDAGTFPVDRDERLALFERWPYLAEALIHVVLLLSGGGVDLEGN